MKCACGKFEFIASENLSPLNNSWSVGDVPFCPRCGAARPVEESQVRRVARAIGEALAKYGWIPYDSMKLNSQAEWEELEAVALAARAAWGDQARVVELEEAAALAVKAWDNDRPMMDAIHRLRTLLNRKAQP